MARESVSLLKGKIDVARVLDQLNAALSEEWLAYYQYWTAAKMVVGSQRVDLQREFMEHAQEELEHASMICDRIIQLGGVPYSPRKSGSNMRVASMTLPQHLTPNTSSRQYSSPRNAPCAVIRKSQI